MKIPRRLKLSTRLFLSYLVIVFVGVGVVTLVGRLTHPWLFNAGVQDLREQGLLNLDPHQEETLVVNKFHEAWEISILLSLTLGGITAAGLSYFAARRITQLLKQFTNSFRQLSEGNFAIRLQPSDIPELGYLSDSFNRMAVSLEQSESQRRDLISDMTHELRTPLTVVRGYLEELADGRIVPSIETYYRLIQETRRLERLVNDLQDLSKAQAGYLPLKLQAFSLYPVLAALVQRFAEQVPDEGPLVSLSCAPALPAVMADRDRTEQILVNLLGNALQYTASGRITVSATAVDSWVWIAISDTGIGIAAAELPHVFDRFWRAEQARQRRSGGTGIGLAIVKSLVELQGGRIEVESQPGQGSTFRFCLPEAAS